MPYLEATRVSLWRYQDPLMGPRKIPTCDDLERGKVRVTEAAVFHVDLEKKSVSVEENGSKFDVGSKLVYVVSD